MNMNATIDTFGERTLRNSSRLLNQGMWILFAIAATLMMILRHSAGSYWVLGLVVVAFLGWGVLRDVARRAGHRHTENKIVSDVKSFLQREPVAPLTPRAPIMKAAPIGSVDPLDDTFAPSRKADFIPLDGVTPYHISAAEPVVFDAIPGRDFGAMRTSFHAVLDPIPNAC